MNLQIFNLLGECIRTVVDDIRQAGAYDVTVDASGLPSGVYYYRIVAGEFMQTKKMMLLR